MTTKFTNFINSLKTPETSLLIESIYKAYKIIFETYDRPYPLEKLPEYLKKCPIHAWRAKTGIELVHSEPDIKEQMRIWKNWNKMTLAQKAISDKKSMELFGITNEKHHRRIINYGRSQSLP